MLPTPASASPHTSGHGAAGPGINITDFTIRIPESFTRKRSGQAQSTSVDTGYGDGKGFSSGSSGSARRSGDVAEGAGGAGRAGDEPSRWGTTEFKVYYLIFALVVPVMVYWPMRLSYELHANYWFYAHRLSPGWLFGRQVDNSDAQYSSFRSNIPGLLSLSIIYLALSSLHSRLSTPHTYANTRTLFLCITSIVVLVILHGISAFKVLGVLYANYRICMAVSGGESGGRREDWGLLRRVWPGVLIVGNMGVLFVCERYGGLPLGGLYEGLAWMDEWSGLLPGWQHHFKITMLRIVSFGLDYHWRNAPANVDAQSEPPTDHRSRVSRPLPADQYNLVNFIAYAIYSPLYIAGPIMTFNDFTWQVRHPVSIPWRQKASYGLRFIFCFLTMESVLHTMYVVAIKDTRAWEGDSPADLSMIGFWNLVVVWLKLLIPWRFFRLWALLDGVDAPENMVRCVANNYSTLGFWRSWHRSYNLWVVRYIYIPVGGGRNAALSTLLVFTFVALWHDLSFKLLAWGWLVSLFILPELAARKFMPYEKYGREPWYRHVAAIGGVGNILLMMSANLVGFVLGIEGMKHLVVQLSTTVEGWLFTAFSCACLFVAVQVMFEYRAEERRRGIDRRC